MKSVIVGAGLSGLILANRLNGHEVSTDRSSVLVVEKSRGVGGRMATRRSDTAKFDHGAQFYARREPLEVSHLRWSAHSLTHDWFERDGIRHFNAPAGMTSLAKELARDLDIRFEQRVEKISDLGAGRWRLTCESGIEFECDRLIFTAPVPQVVEILKRSAVNYDSTLDRIQYSKAIVALLELSEPSSALCVETGYREFESGALFSLADQARKGLSKTPSLTVTLSAKTSEELYEKSDEEIAGVVRAELGKLDGSLAIRSIQIKKWRFNKPLMTYGALFCEASPSLYLVGDGFGGASLNGAARSANALAAHFLNQK